MRNRKSFLQMRNSPSKQKGLVLIDIVLGGALLLVLLSAYAKWEIDKTERELADSAKTKLEYIIEKSQMYYMARIYVDGNEPTDTSNYPSSYDDLTDKGYIAKCSSQDEMNNKCVDYSLLPIGGGEAVVFNVSTDTDGYAQLKLSFDLSNESNAKRKNLIRQSVIKVPGYTMDDDVVTITVTRPGSALAFDNVVLRDGTHDMTDDWDFGGTAKLENVKDITFEGLTDRTALTGIVKNGSVYVEDQNGAVVTKPECPAGYNPTITTYFIGTGGDTEFTEMGNIDTYYRSTSPTTWQVNIRFAALKSGETSRAWQYTGNVGYWTWCDL
ncbi:hypothetical protein HUO09_17055 [Vibrio sp. Y2-5]|uniref:hypothetical protein n=1 Tax=Vibrio sp. Y2-5 TaxID=2743977 RepID=UPI00166174CC|nr:hypothetical protein [Vibrio sp. Y2-5]MBD0788065.1 hypothetical protein [Vibrio sp. Y2-5]